MEIISNFTFRYKVTTIFVVILFYAVGVLGIVIPITHAFFVALIPVVLLLSFILVVMFHNSSQNRADFLVFLLIFLLSFFVEVLGVNTHVIFGNYRYGDGLGIKIFGTPLMIGINWVLLIYSSASILELTKWRAVNQVFMASLLMVLFDLILEHVAPLLDMWEWHENTIPIQNYLAWFALALIFQGIQKRMKISTVNPVASTIFICQFIFFITILILLN
jgi:bisanhydrobacterioruberin hydratase